MAQGANDNEDPNTRYHIGYGDDRPGYEVPTSGPGPFIIPGVILFVILYFALSGSGKHS